MSIETGNTSTTDVGSSWITCYSCDQLRLRSQCYRDLGGYRCRSCVRGEGVTEYVAPSPPAPPPPPPVPLNPAVVPVHTLVPKIREEDDSGAYQADMPELRKRLRRLIDTGSFDIKRPDAADHLQGLFGCRQQRAARLILLARGGVL